MHVEADLGVRELDSAVRARSALCLALEGRRRRFVAQTDAEPRIHRVKRHEMKVHRRAAANVVGMTAREGRGAPVLLRDEEKPVLKVAPDVHELVEAVAAIHPNRRHSAEVGRWTHRLVDTPNLRAIAERKAPTEAQTDRRSWTEISSRTRRLLREGRRGVNRT